MSANNKLLLGLVAVVALVIGVAVNSPRPSSITNTDALLNAKLQSTTTPPTVGSQLGELTLVNFWASWCAPCREEMPIFEAMYRQHKASNFQIIGIAIDSTEKAQPFLDSMDISYPILYAENTGMQIMEASGNPQGLLPYSLLLDSNGAALEQVIGKINEQDIANWLTQYLSVEP